MVDVFGGVESVKKMFRTEFRCGCATWLMMIIWRNRRLVIRSKEGRLPMQAEVEATDVRRYVVWLLDWTIGSKD